MLVDSQHSQSLEINAANDHGDTPLHIAARWGFSKLNDYQMPFLRTARKA